MTPNIHANLELLPDLREISITVTGHRRDGYRIHFCHMGETVEPDIAFVSPAAALSWGLMTLDAREAST